MSYAHAKKNIAAFNERWLPRMKRVDDKVRVKKGEIINEMQCASSTRFIAIVK